MPENSNFKVVGYENAPHYRNYPKTIDEAVFDNEDIGLINAISADDAYEFALPYPADVDLDTEALQLYWIDFMYQASPLLDSDLEVVDLLSLDIGFSMFDADFNSTNPMNTLDDTNSLEFKKLFDGFYQWHMTKVQIEQGTAGNLITIDGSDLQGVNFLRWIPVERLDLPLPLFIQFVNRSKELNEGDLGSAISEVAFPLANTEFVALRPWYTSRKLTKSERQLRDQAKYLELGA